MCYTLFNSLGGFTALVAAASLTGQVKGVSLLNSAGQFGDASSAAKETEETALQKLILKPLKEIFQRVFLGFLFWQAKQPARIESVLKSVCSFITNSSLYSHPPRKWTSKLLDLFAPIHA